VAKEWLALLLPKLFLGHLLDLLGFAGGSLANTYHLGRPLEARGPTLSPRLELAAAELFEFSEYSDDVPTGDVLPCTGDVRLNPIDGRLTPVSLATCEVIQNCSGGRVAVIEGAKALEIDCKCTRRHKISFAIYSILQTNQEIFNYNKRFY
jgi:hypothetical protein